MFCDRGPGGVVLKRTVVLDLRFDNLSGSHHWSQEKKITGSCWSQVNKCLSVYGVLSLVR